jgi:hypothetical protein
VAAVITRRRLGQHGITGREQVWRERVRRLDARDVPHCALETVRGGSILRARTDEAICWIGRGANSDSTLALL